MTAWAAGKFGADLIGPFVKKSGIAEKVKHRKVIIPGYAAVISGELEEELPDWQIQIGPREAGHIPAFLKNVEAGVRQWQCQWSVSVNEFFTDTDTNH